MWTLSKAAICQSATLDPCICMPSLLRMTYLLVHVTVYATACAVFAQVCVNLCFAGGNKVVDIEDVSVALALRQVPSTESYQGIAIDIQSALNILIWFQ